MDLPVAALIAAGFDVRAVDPGATVQADVLTGQDGRAHAIRLLRKECQLMTRRILIFLGSCLAPGALWAQAGLALPGAPSAVIGVGQAGPVAGKPFSGVETRHMTQILGDGTRVDRSDTSNFYRDAAGRMRTESPDRVLIYDAVAKVVYDLDPKHKTYSRRADEATSVSIAVVNGGTYVRSRSGNVPSLPSHVDLGIPYHEGTGVHSSTEDLPRQFLNGISVKGSRLTSNAYRREFSAMIEKSRLSPSGGIRRICRCW